MLDPVTAGKRKAEVVRKGLLAPQKCWSLPSLGHLDRAPTPPPPHIALALSGEALGRLQRGLPSITSGCQTRRPPPSELPPLGSLRGGGLQDQLLGSSALSSPSPLTEGTLTQPGSRTMHRKSIHWMTKQPQFLRLFF